MARLPIGQTQIHHGRAGILKTSGNSSAAISTILHLGHPKTGTTTLQEQVFAKLGETCFLGKPWWTPTVPYDKCVALHRAIDGVTKADPRGYDADEAARAVADWLAHAPAAAAREDGSFAVRLLSEERLVLTDVVGMDEIARRLAQLFPGAEIVYVRRDPVASLRSSFRWLHARNWIDGNFSDWLASGLAGDESRYAGVALRAFDWALIEQSFGARFPVVRHLDFAQMRADPVAFLDALIGHAHAEHAGFAFIAQSALNVSRPRAVSEMHRLAKKGVRLWNRLPLRKLDEKPEYLGDTPIWQRLERVVRHIPMNEARLEASVADREKIMEYYFGTRIRDGKACMGGAFPDRRGGAGP